MLAALFGKNPFGPLREHMAKTLECVDETGALFAALHDGNRDAVHASAVRISQLEAQADDIKDQLRAGLNRSRMFAVDRRDVLAVLHHMDAIADQAEDIGVLLTLRWMELPEALWGPLDEFRSRAEKTVLSAAALIEQLETLVDGGFGPSEAERIMKSADEVNRLEHEADKAQDAFGKALFEHEDEMKPAALFMWIKIANKIGDLANAAERVANQLRVMLAGI